jgi:hypothetical protein
VRDYGKVAPGFWTGKTGKALKAKGPEAVIVALYLVTCQHANMLGMYYLSKTYIAVDTPLGFEGACKGLAGACEAGFCRYDEDSEVVWVVEMASYQIGEPLDAKDNRCKGVQREYDALPENPFLAPFYERYGACFHMTSMRGAPPKKTSPSKAPRKPLRSQEQEQEQEQEQQQDQEQEHAQDVFGRPARAGKPGRDAPPKSAEAWAAYSAAYEARYGVPPVRNAQVNSQLGQLVDKLGAEEAPMVAAFYLTSRNRFYVGAGHSVGLLVKDAEKLRTEWATGRQSTATEATLADRTQANFNAFAPLIAEAQAKELFDAQQKVA